MTTAWDVAERMRLRDVRMDAGHNMATCAQILRTQFGVTTASQPNISRWESGVTRRPHCVNELLEYCDTYGQGDWASVAVRTDPPSDDRGESDTLAGEAGEAGEAVEGPLVGLAQLELVRGMNRRLAYGPPMSAEDRATYLDQLRILHVPQGAANG